MIFDSDNDTGPIEILFATFAGYNVRLNGADGTLRGVAHVPRGRETLLGAKFQRFQDGDDIAATGATIEIPFDDIRELIVY